VESASSLRAALSITGLGLPTLKAFFVLGTWALSVSRGQSREGSVKAFYIFKSWHCAAPQAFPPELDGGMEEG
jgi:hypothetical protein